jgi:hypothetical protein
MNKTTLIYSFASLLIAGVISRLVLFMFFKKAQKVGVEREFMVRYINYSYAITIIIWVSAIAIIYLRYKSQ